MNTANMSADLRDAALSDHKHGTTHLLDLLLPDVPGEPYGGYATQEQVSAVFNAIGTVFDPRTRCRPENLRTVLRYWAARQAPLSGSLREQLADLVRSNPDPLSAADAILARYAVIAQDIQD